MSITDRHKRSFIESLSVKKVGNRSALADVVTKSRETFFLRRSVHVQVPVQRVAGGR